MRVAWPSQIGGRGRRLSIAVVSMMLLSGAEVGGKHFQHTAVRDRASRTALRSSNGWLDGVGMPYAHFAEIEVSLNESLTAVALARLPQAPGSRVRVLDGGRRATAQLAAEIVGDLIEQGHDVTVLRDIMLSEKLDVQMEAREETGAARASLHSQGAVGDSNEMDLAISEWEWVYSDIRLSQAPSKAVVTSVDVHIEVVHPAVEELWIDLCNESRTRRCNVWFMETHDGQGLSKTMTGITEFAGERANQFWSLRATDARAGNVGYIDSWWIKVYYEGPWDVGLPDDPNYPVVVTDGVPYSGTTRGATGQGESRCGVRDALDVWHAYTPVQTALTTLRVRSDDFDTTLAVYDPSGVEVACGDDDCEGTDSMIMMPMLAGTEYLIRVAGYDEETGEYTLTVRSHSAVLPTRPNEPDPADGAEVDRIEIVLAWDGASPAVEANREAIQLSGNRTRRLATVYGTDDRVEEYEVTDPNLRAAGSAVGLLVRRADLVDLGGGMFELAAQSFAWWYQQLDPLGTGHALCLDEPFRDQPSVGTCAVFLVASDLVGTAGHCVACDRAVDWVVLFDFVMEDALTPVTRFHGDQIYDVAEVIGYHVGYPDWGLMRLNRHVVGRTPLPLRRDGRVADGQRLVVIGHPWGLPRKYDAGATVQQNTEPTFFQANLDTYQGNSGSPVINADSMQVEGIVCRGMDDFVEDVAMGCDRSRVCPDGGCPSDDGAEWEDATRATAFGMMVPVYDVYLGVDPTRLDCVATDVVVPRYRPQGLRKDTTYYWQVVARSACGWVEGPVWSFHTALRPGTAGPAASAANDG